MDKEYIEREAAKRELLSWAVCMNHPEYLMRDDALHVIDSIPAADVAPVRHGRWKAYSDCGVTRCSVCDWSIEECIDYKFCPNCGCRMDGGDD